MPTFAALDVPARFGDPAGTLAWIDRALARTRAEVVLLPEACLSGYLSPRDDADPATFAEALDGPTSRAFADRARVHGMHIGWPLIEQDGGRVFNSYCVTGPSGERVVHYRKRHPWYPETWATAGAQPHPVFDLAGLVATLAICFDVHFLPDDGAEALRRADVVLFPSAWVESVPGEDTRAELFARLARAWDVAVVNANWSQGDVAVAGQGGSRIVGADGAVLARTGETGIATAAIARR